MFSRARLGRVAVSMAVLLFALMGCTATTPTESSPIAATFHHGVLEAERDGGSSVNQQAVRRAAAAALTDEHRAFIVSKALRGEIQL